MFLDNAPPPPPHSSIIPLDIMCTLKHFKMNEINRYGKKGGTKPAHCPRIQMPMRHVVLMGSETFVSVNSP